MPQKSPEYRVYKILEHWKPTNEILLVEELTDPKRKLAPLFSYIYNKIKEVYKGLPKRKDGQDPFVHPLNVVWDLKKAQVEDDITLCAALLHDFVEEKIDLHKVKNKIKEDKEGIQLLDKHELEVFRSLENELEQFCEENSLDLKFVEEIITILKLLTRHKKHYYYRSISNIFRCKDEQIKAKAIQIKLADRIHNVQSLESFDEQEKIYQCFKNIFILNNTKKYLRERFGERTDPNKKIYSTDRLFVKCCKATFDTFLNVCRNCLYDKEVYEVSSMLQLAFRKFAHEWGGLWKITATGKKGAHPIWLYHEIVKKYDARLHQERNRFEKIKKEEKAYCKKFFADYNFNEKQLQAIINYKDAYALKEVVARLLYKPNYIIPGFGCSELCCRGMICTKA